MLWQDQFSGTARGSGASDITTRGRRVFVVGSILNSAPPVEGPEDISSAFAVRSYDGKTGELLWQDQFVGTGDGFDFDVDDHANAIAVRGNRIFVVGSIVNQLTVGDFAVRTYDAKSGSLLWQDQFDGTASGEDDDEAYAITVKGERVFVAGSIENEESFSDFTVRAYDAKTGRLLWQDQANGTANGYDHATDIAVQGQRVFAAGSVVNQDVGSDFTVRAYDARSGRLLWQNQFNGTAGDYDSASDIAVRGKRVLVAGSVVNQDTGRQFHGSRL